MESETVSLRVKQAPDGQFRSCIAAANPPHHFRSSFPRDPVHDPSISALQLEVTCSLAP